MGSTGAQWSTGGCHAVFPAAPTMCRGWGNPAGSGPDTQTDWSTHTNWTDGLLLIRGHGLDRLDLRLGLDVPMALQGLLDTPGAGPRCLLCLVLFLSIAVTNKGMEEQSGIFLCEGVGFPNHDLKSWGGCLLALSSFGPFTSLYRNHRMRPSCYLTHSFPPSPEHVCLTKILKGSAVVSSSLRLRNIKGWVEIVNILYKILDLASSHLCWSHVFMCTFNIHLLEIERHTPCLARFLAYGGHSISDCN